MLGLPLLLLVLNGPAVGETESLEMSDNAERLITALHQVRVVNPPPLEPLVVELGDRATFELEFLLGVLVERSIPAFGDKERQILSETQEELLLLALAEVPGSRTQEWAAKRLEEGSMQEALAGLLVLGAVGERAALEVATVFAASLSEEDFTRSMRRALLDCGTGILTRDEESLRFLEAHWSSFPDRVISVMIESITRAGRPIGLAVLADLLEARRDLASNVLPMVRALTPAHRQADTLEMAAAARPFIFSVEKGLASAACLVAGELDDIDSIPDLISCLERPPGPVREAALRSLQQIGAAALADDAEIWRQWFAREEKWVRSEWPKLRQQLTASSTDSVLKALRDLSLHPLYRHRLSGSIVPLLGHRKPWMRATAARNLAELGSCEAVPALIEALGDRDTGVRDESLSALKVLTALDGEADREAWYELALEHNYLAR